MTSKERLLLSSQEVYQTRYSVTSVSHLSMMHSAVMSKAEADFKLSQGFSLFTNVASTCMYIHISTRFRNVHTATANQR